MNLKTRLVSIGMLGLILAGCASVPPLTGTVEDKYIEDFTEHTIVVKADNGEMHHFTITEDQWESFNKGDRINTDALETPTED